MKKVIFNIFLIFTIFTLCFLQIQKVSAEKNENIFVNSYEYNKIINNKEHIIKVVKESYSEGGFEAQDCSIEKAYEKVQSLKKIRKSDMSVLDADSCYIFQFDDDTKVKINFEGQFLHYKGQNYEIIENK